ncbi:porin family protein [Emticicia sp. 17c]|uniref:porin family protein n=1 Tax=Emticicia sp. 17c TaxID=3127704 RepID=UPI00301C8CDE
MRTIFKTLALLLFTHLTFAQRIQLGARGGASWSTMTKFDLIENITPTFRLMPSGTGAIFADFAITDKFSVRPELAYIQKGFLVKESLSMGGADFLGINIPVGGTLAFKTNYYEIPVLAKFKLGNPNAPHAYLLAGPSVGYMGNAKAVIKVLGIFPISPSVSTDFFHRFEFSGVGGLGVDFPVGNGNIFIEGRYQHGFSRVLDIPMIQLPVRNRSLGVSAGFSFPIGYRE